MDLLEATQFKKDSIFVSNNNIDELYSSAFKRLMIYSSQIHS